MRLRATWHGNTLPTKSYTVLPILSTVCSPYSQITVYLSHSIAVYLRYSARFYQLIYKQSSLFSKFSKTLLSESSRNSPYDWETIGKVLLVWQKTLEQQVHHLLARSTRPVQYYKCSLWNSSLRFRDTYSEEKGGLLKERFIWCALQYFTTDALGEKYKSGTHEQGGSAHGGSVWSRARHVE